MKGEILNVTNLELVENNSEIYTWVLNLKEVLK